MKGLRLYVFILSCIYFPRTVSDPIGRDEARSIASGVSSLLDGANKLRGQAGLTFDRFSALLSNNGLSLAERALLELIDEFVPFSKFITEPMLTELKQLFDTDINPRILDDIMIAFDNFSTSNPDCLVAPFEGIKNRFNFLDLAYPFSTCPLYVTEVDSGYKRTQLTFEFYSRYTTRMEIASPVIIKINDLQFPLDYNAFWVVSEENRFVEKLLFMGHDTSVDVTEDFSVADMDYLDGRELYGCFFQIMFLRYWGQFGYQNSEPGYIKETLKMPLNIVNKFASHKADKRRYCPFHTYSRWSNCLRNLCYVSVIDLNP